MKPTIRMVFWYLLVFISSLTLSFSIHAQDRNEGPLAESYRLERAGNYEGSIKAMLKLKQKGFYYGLRMGWLLYLDGKYRNSLDSYSKALEARPKSVSAHLGLYYSYTALGINTKATELLERAHQIHPFNKDIGVKLLKVYFQAAKWSKGLKVAGSLYQAYPDDLAILEYQVLFNQSLGKIEEAKKYAYEVLAISPHSSVAFRAIQVVPTAKRIPSASDWTTITK